MSGDRPQRLGRLLKEEISKIFQEEIHDPIIKAISLLTVTDVVVSLDLKIAKVYLSLFGEPEKAKEAFAKICRASAFIRFKISEKLKELKFIPEIRFCEDKTPAEAAQIMELFHRLEEENKHKKESNETARKNKPTSKKR